MQHSVALSRGSGAIRVPRRCPCFAPVTPRVAHRRPQIHVPASSAEAEQKPDRLSYDHLLLTILDSNPELSSSSWQAVATAADLATLHNGRVTVLVVDEQVARAEAGAGAGDQSRLQQQAAKIAQTLGKYGIKYEILERQVVGSQAKDAEGRSSVVVGEVADEVAADLLVLHSAAVHNKTLDANLLAEFVSCPMLLLP
ncbi:hypothetical protein Rsub_09268 [Raphidocelis subcapitata]|uniref:UspA domain-containing protein n=1 Tax=Raphidocelis subcapitata TaxID=307507 RepID=A0A2V0PAC6_9CHLO|nr:hypothetical protein Rsub_09268 [Raphidocelis subcapitata]|eukprot:GBF96469.1 hypothetical protein Rsub_09268 [Raphidocelis subcapitata]